MTDKKPKNKVWVLESSQPDDKEPPNNDGRSVCWWCGSNTVKRHGFTGVYDICETCER